MLCILCISQSPPQPVSATLFLSSSDSRPMYQQIIDQVSAKVAAGDWPAGHPLPSIRELASESQVSVITVKRAYLELELAGVIVTRHGKGSFVAETADLSKALQRAELERHLQSLVACAIRLGLDREQLQRHLDAALAAAHPTLPTRGPQP
jgi:GntR family transcriptional regulator